jgi:signal transduction histidine kinase
MQEGYREPYLPEEDIARWCSILFENATTMDRAASLDEALGRLARNMATFASVDSCIVLVRARDQFKPMASYGVGEPGVDQVTLSGGAASAVEKKEPVMACAGDIGLPQTDKYRHTAFMCVPLVSRGKPVGLAVLFTAGKRQKFSGGTLHVLVVMAMQGAHAIDDFYYKEELGKRSDELRRVYEIQRRITQSIDLDEAAESIVENAPYITRLQYCMIYLLDPYKRNIVSIKAPAAVEKKFGKLEFGLDELVASRIAMDERKPLFIEDAPSYPRISQPIVQKLGFKSAIVLPLIARDRVLGVMWLYTTDRKVRFDEDDKRSAIALSDQAAIVIDNARIFKELEESYEKMKDLDKTKMEFFTLISHELRNPLAVIKGFTELLYDGTLGPLNDKQKDKLLKIKENVDKLTDMVNKMSEISTMETRRYPLEKIPTSISWMVGEIVDTMGFLFRNKHITVKVNIPPELPLVEVDRGRMEQVLLNLLNNALKYTPEGGEVDVSAEDRGNEILVSIHDTGIGIPKKDLDKIFTGFYHAGYKLSYEYKGPGLGLAISRKIVESHGGRIWAESEPGKGSTFYFTIPKHPENIETLKNTANAA